MKKILAMLLALTMVFSLGAMAFADDEITLDVIICQYGPNTQDWFLGTGMDGTNFVDKFEAENPDIKLNLEVVSWNDVYTVADTRIADGALDILNIDLYANYANEGLLEPVSQWCPEDLYEDFFPAFIEQSVFNGTVWAVPDLASVRALWYNVDMFEEMDIEPPTTWAELEDACQTILDFYEGDVYPWGIDMTTDEGQAAFAYYISGNGGSFIDEENNWTLNRPENVEAIQFALSLVENGYTNPNPATQTRYDLQDMFAAGDMAMVIGPNNMDTYCADKDSEVNMAYSGIPTSDGSTMGVAIMDRVMAFKDESLSEEETAARDEAIGKFAEFFYRPENYVGWVSMEGFLPAVNSSVESLVAENPDFATWLDVLDGCKFYPVSLSEWDAVKQGVIKAEQNALTGASIQDELDALQADIVAQAEAAAAKAAEAAEAAE